MYNILVCDDEEGIRTLISKYAKFEGHNVTLAENATGNVIININGENHTVPITNGTAQLNLTNLTVGHKVKVKELIAFFPSTMLALGNFCAFDAPLWSWIRRWLVPLIIVTSYNQSTSG